MDVGLSLISAHLIGDVVPFFDVLGFVSGYEAVDCLVPFSVDGFLVWGFPSGFVLDEDDPGFIGFPLDCCDCHFISVANKFAIGRLSVYTIYT